MPEHRKNLFRPTRLAPGDGYFWGHNHLDDATYHLQAELQVQLSNRLAPQPPLDRINRVAREA